MNVLLMPYVLVMTTSKSLAGTRSSHRKSVVIGRVGIGSKVRVGDASAGMVLLGVNVGVAVLLSRGVADGRVVGGTAVSVTVGCDGGVAGGGAVSVGMGVATGSSGVDNAATGMDVDRMAVGTCVGTAVSA